jgi:hypothetical protein
MARKKRKAALAGAASISENDFRSSNVVTGSKPRQDKQAPREPVTAMEAAYRRALAKRGRGS